MEAKSNNVLGLPVCLWQERIGSRCSGKERDETNLDYFGARYFSGAMGRFTSPDPKRSSARLKNPQRWNRYTYVTNNPLQYIDPDGKEMQLRSFASPKHKERMIKNFVELYRTSRGRTAIHKMKDSPILFTFGSGKLPSAGPITRPDGGITVGIRFGNTKAFGPPDRSKINTVKITIDYDNHDQTQTAITAGLPVESPLKSVQDVFNNEAGHSEQFADKPLETLDLTDKEREQYSDDFEEEVKKDKKDMSKEEALEMIKKLLGITELD